MSLFEVAFEECDVYVKRCLVIKKCLDKEFADYQPEMTFNEDINLFIISLYNPKRKCRIIVSLLRDTKWHKLKKYIYKRIDEIDETECQICNGTIMKIRPNCNKCGNSYCGECYINIFKFGRGIVRCPFCRWKYGSELPDQLIDIGVCMLREKFNMG